jgi:hypothetical protein
VCPASPETSLQRATPDENGIRVLSVKSGERFKVKSSPPRYLVIAIRYKIIQAGGHLGPWKASNLAYNYTLYDEDETEVLAYHWHPNVGPPTTHLHLYQASGAVAYLAKRHMPTERISVEEFLRFVIEELRVQPIRNDWSDILKSNYQLHRRYRTWPK